MVASVWKAPSGGYLKDARVAARALILVFGFWTPIAAESSAVLPLARKARRGSELIVSSSAITVAVTTKGVLSS